LRELESFEPAGPVFYNKARDGGLGHHAQRTWARLNQVGAATVEELSETVGYTPATILKHLQGLERYSMAKLRSGGAWAATGKSQWSAAKEHSLPDRWAGNRARVFGAAFH
jgi:predicted transcriptional regulator